jgi:dATP pyrophosphohydrolase
MSERRPEEVFVFVRRGEQFLVLHRSERNGSYWHGVAGALEDGEDYGHAAARELEEETGLVARPLEVGGDYSYRVGEDPEWRTRYPPGTEEIRVRSYLVDVPGDWEPRLDWEHDEYRWCTAEEAEALLYWPEPRQVLRTLA